MVDGNNIKFRKLGGLIFDVVITIYNTVGTIHKQLLSEFVKLRAKKLYLKNVDCHKQS